MTDEIRTEPAGRRASVVSAVPGCGASSCPPARDRRGGGGGVLDGRDIGTVVFPKADVKFFLTAAPEARARRRLEEERAPTRRDFEATLADITDRDRRDSTRADPPLPIADDAVVIDTTELSADEVFQPCSEPSRTAARRAPQGEDGCLFRRGGSPMFTGIIEEWGACAGWSGGARACV